MWEDTERAGDIWNGRWTRQTLEEILIEHSDSQIPPAEYVSALAWLKQLTLLLQNAQTALYSVRRQILRQSSINPPNHITLRRPRNKRRGPRTQTLFAAWHIQYSRGAHPPKRPPRYTYQSDLAPRIAPLRQTVLGYCATHARPRTQDSLRRTSSTRKRAPKRFQRRSTKTTEREDHRTTQVKLSRPQ